MTEILATLQATIVDLNQQLSFWKQLVDIIGQAVVVTDAQGIITYWNQAAEQLYGWSAAEAHGRSVIELLTPSDRQTEATDQLQHVIARGGMPNEYLALRRDGTQVPINGITTVIRDSHNNVTGIVGVWLDISERKAAEEALRSSEARFRAVWEQATDAFVLSDEQGSVVMANPAYCQLYEQTIEEVIGQPFEHVFPADQHEEARRSYFRAFAEGAAGNRFEATIPRRDGSHRIVESRIDFIEENGQRSLMLSVIRDITELRRAEQLRQAEALQQMQIQRRESISMLASGIAHDFNNLLTVIHGHAELLRDVLASDPELCDMVEAIAHSTHRATKLTEQMLAYAGKNRLTLWPVRLDALVNELSDLLRTSAGPTHQLELITTLDVPYTLIDVAQIRQVLVNLIVNASEALDSANGTITIHIGTEELSRATLSTLILGTDLPAGNYVYIMVDDTGIGIEPTLLPHIFEPFFSTKFVGRGLGLSVVYGIVHSHHGAIRVTSTPGIGTRFQIWLPTIEPTALLHAHI